MIGPAALRGLTDRTAYLAASAGVFFLQHLVAWLVLRRPEIAFAPQWWFWFNPLRAVATAMPEPVSLGAMAVTLACSAGLTALTFARARRTGWAEGFAALAIVPGVQILVVLWFALAPRRPRVESPTPPDGGWRSPSIIQGLLIGAALSLALEAFSALVLGLYGYGLFILAPLIIGLASGYVGNRKVDLGGWSTVGLVLNALLLGALGLVGFALEGLICLVLAAPLIVGMGIVGGLIGRALARRGKAAQRSTLASVALTPLLLIAEVALPPRASFESVESIEVAAPPAAVWDAIVHMGPIPEPPPAPFRWGLAYPMRGEIHGQGVGAIRRGVFSTGVAYERVTDWRPNEALSFIVLSDPPTMRELSPYAHVNAPHVDGYFRTLDARFTIAPMANGKTRLSLATRHELDLEPALYWAPLAQWATHANKTRVLEHFRRQAEASIG